MEDYYYRQVIEKSSFGYANHRIVLDEENNPIDYIFLEVNEAFEKLTGLKKEQVLGKSLKTVLPPDAIKDFDWVKIYSEVALEGKELKFEQYSAPLKRWYRVEAFSREKYYFTTIFFDITKEKNIIDELNGFFDVNLDLLCIASMDGIFLKLNKEWERVLGYKINELEGMNFLDFIHPDDIENTKKAMEKLEGNHKVLNFVNRYRTKEGTYRHIEWRSYPTGEKVYAAARDLTERIEVENSLREMSIRDPLTNVYNRRYIFERLKEIEEKYRRIEEKFSIAIIDIDRFKLVNDNYGHLAGDFVLKEFSKLISESIRPFDLFGRFGGEEFILVLLNCTKQDAEKRIEGILNQIREKVFGYDNQEIRITFSCGIADNKDFPNIGIDKLIDIADRREYKAKDMGRNRIVIENNY